MPNTGTDSAAQDDSMGNIRAELTTTTRTGLHRYTFPKAGEVSVVMDLNYTYHGTDIRNAVLDVEQTEEGNAVLSGRFSARNVSGHGKYTMYFYMETDTPVTDIHTWNGDNYGTGTSLSGNDLGAVLSFEVKEGQAVQVKVGISPISSEQAKIDMAAENAGWDFTAVREQAKADWNSMLGRVDIQSSETSDPDGSLRTLFYTGLYRMFMTPRRQLHKDIRQDIRRHDIIASVSHFILHCLVVNEVPDHYLILLFRDAVHFHVLMGSVDGARIQVRPDRIRRPELQRQHAEDPAPASHV